MMGLNLEELLFICKRMIQNYESRWNCIFEAGASITSLAFEFERKKYIPALLEEIDSEQEEAYFNGTITGYFWKQN